MTEQPKATPEASPPASDEDAPKPEEKTEPYRLKALAERLGRQRRRATAGALLVRRPHQQEVRVPLERDETRIGRDPGADIVLTEESASREHAEVRRTAAGYFEVVDLASDNGVWVDGERVERMTLLDGDVFTIGDTVFAVIVGPAVGAPVS